ncbi:hypothetical protein Naga_100315g3 [Nannochloropsis gaditana]|uniref:Uncharacterized protein n=1 Tax=Nannochloropsis gaditana TaxID=72520 RepID=W7TIX9_9STRA|nr:hypothetical protein Naga_100315g3 [Nannochloropsis gaditana]
MSGRHPPLPSLPSGGAGPRKEGRHGGEKRCKLSFWTCPQPGPLPDPLSRPGQGGRLARSSVRGGWGTHLPPPCLPLHVVLFPPSIPPSLSGTGLEPSHGLGPVHRHLPAETGVDRGRGGRRGGGRPAISRAAAGSANGSKRAGGGDVVGEIAMSGGDFDRDLRRIPRDALGGISG